MNDTDCVSFLQWCLPRLGFRWPGFRKVRKQVCKRVARRMSELNLQKAADYRAYIEHNSEEWNRLDTMCCITISRFYRDTVVFDTLRERLLAEVARGCADAGRFHVDCWCAGCCSGEEPYTLQIIWQLSVLPKTRHSMPLHVVATDVDAHLLTRARAAVYPAASLRDLPNELWAAFEGAGGERSVKPDFQRHIEWLEQDLRRVSPEGPFDMVFCRNLAFTYYVETLQEEILENLHRVLRDDGLLVIGSHEKLPDVGDGMFQLVSPCVYKRMPRGPT